MSEFARRLGMSQSVVSRYLQGTMKPGYGFFEKLHQANINVHWLFSGEGDPHLPERDHAEGLLLEKKIRTLDDEGRMLVQDLVESYRRIRTRKRRK